MKKLLGLSFLLVLTIAGVVQIAAAQDASAVWNALSQPVFDGSKSATVENIEIARDRIRITLIDGTIRFAQPANGVEFAAAFEGRGKLQIVPPDPRETQQLQLLTHASAVNMDFTQAVFSSADGFFDEIARQVRWGPASSNQLAGLYAKQQTDREDLGIGILPRLFQGVMSQDHVRTAYLAAEMKTSQAGWVLARYDALDPEEVWVGRWQAQGPVNGFDTWMHFPAGNVTSSAAFDDPLAKDTMVVRGYKIDTTLTGGGEISATADVRLDERVSGERVGVFDLDPNARVSSVKNAQGAPLAFFQAREQKDRPQDFGRWVAVVLAQPSQAEKTETLEFQYAGKRVVRTVGAGMYFCPSYGWYPGQPNQFATRTDFDLTFHYPKRDVLIATGSPVDKPHDGTAHWKSDIPLAVAGFAFGDLKESDRKIGSVELDVAANRNANDALRGALAVADLPGVDPNYVPPVGSLDASRGIGEMTDEIGNCLLLFENYYGPFPYSRLSVTDIPFNYGQGWPGLLYLSSTTFLDQTQRHLLGVTDQTRASDFFRAHETSHQWWGHRVGWKSYHDQWMSEGFAQFSGNLYVEYRQNFGEYLKRIRLDRENLLHKNAFGHTYDSLGPVWMGERLASSQAPASSQEPDGYDVVIYDKGGLILHMIRMMLRDVSGGDPDHIFKDTMHDFTQTYDNKAASTEDFKAIVEKHMLSHMDLEGKHNLDWFFRQYVYGTGVPHYKFTYQVTEESGKWVVNGTVTRTEVPDTWMDTLPIYVHVGKDSMLIGWLRDLTPTTPVRFTLPMKPDKVSLNDNEDILAIVDQ